MSACSLICAAVMLVSLLPTTDGNTCQEQQLSQPHFASFVSLPLVHPGHVLLRNLVSGSCSLDEYNAQRQRTMGTISNTEATIELLGGLVSESSEPVNVSSRLPGSGSSTSDTSKGQCTQQEPQDACAQRYTRELFSAIADDPEASVQTWNGALQLPSALNSRS